MEALWNIEDKWKLTTQEAFLLLGCVALAVIGLGVVTFLKRSRRKEVAAENSELWWAGGSDRQEGADGFFEVEQGQEVGGEAAASTGGGGWHSHNSEPPVWQKADTHGGEVRAPKVQRAYSLRRERSASPRSS